MKANTAKLLEGKYAKAPNFIQKQSNRLSSLITDQHIAHSRVQNGLKGTCQGYQKDNQQGTPLNTRFVSHHYIYQPQQHATCNQALSLESFCYIKLLAQFLLLNNYGNLQPNPKYDQMAVYMQCESFSLLQRNTSHQNFHTRCLQDSTHTMVTSCMVNGNFCSKVP